MTTRTVMMLTLLLGAGVFAGVFHALSNDPAAVSISWGIALLIGGISLAFFGDHRFDMFSPLFFIGMSFAFFYGVPAIAPFALENAGAFAGTVVAVQSYYPLAGMTSFLCMLGLFLGYSSSFAAYAGRSSSLLWWRTSACGEKLLWMVLLAMGVGAFLFLLASDVYLQTTEDLESPLFYSAVGFIQSGLYVAIGFAVASAYKNRTTFWIVAALVTFCVALLFGIPSGSKTLALLAFMLSALAVNYAHKPFSRLTAGVGVFFIIAILAVLMPFNVLYRTQLLTSNYAGQSLSESAVMLKQAAGELADMSIEESIDLTLDYSIARLSNLSVVANVLRYQEQGGTLHYGSSYALALFGLIPRFIWPEKPGLTVGQAIAVELGYSDPKAIRLGTEVSNNAVGITMVGEQVYNFSWVLAPFGMALLGMFYRWIYEVFKSGLRIAPRLAVGIYAYWWYGLVFSAHESNFAAIFMGTVKFTVFLFIFFYVLTFKWIAPKTLVSN